VTFTTEIENGERGKEGWTLVFRLRAFPRRKEDWEAGICRERALRVRERDWTKKDERGVRTGEVV